MDIFINGKHGAGKTRAAELLLKNFSRISGQALHVSDVLYIHDEHDLRNVRLLVETIRAARVRAVVFDESIANGACLLIAVQAVKEYRQQINADILAIYVQQSEVIAVKDLADNMPQLLDNAILTEADTLLQRSKPNAPASPPPARKRKESETLPVYASATQVPLTYDEGTNAYTSANLVEDGKILVEALNVYAFEGALRLGSGHREPVSMLFELANIVPVSNLHVAVDKMNTHYFRTGTFEKRAFNAKNCRPATPAEVMEYLNIKLNYTKSL